MSFSMDFVEVESKKFNGFVELLLIAVKIFKIIIDFLFMEHE
jgi:hypothetical protein